MHWQITQADHVSEDGIDFRSLAGDCVDNGSRVGFHIPEMHSIEDIGREAYANQLHKIYFWLFVAELPIIIQVLRQAYVLSQKG